MENKKIITIFVLGLFALALLQIALADVAIKPSQPSAMTLIKNESVGGLSGTLQNDTRGYIYYYQIDESAPTIKWKAYVGNITGEYALQDSSGSAIYDWTMTDVQGEIYATHENPTANSDQWGGGVPNWTAVTCANTTMIQKEEEIFNHTSTDEDSYTNTFFNGNTFNLTTFYAGTKEVTDSTVANSESGGCYGTYLMYNNTENTTTRWEEVVLTDLTYQDHGGSNQQWDTIYVALILNNYYGFDNITYDFQIMVPEVATEGNQPNTPYWFYLELV